MIDTKELRRKLGSDDPIDNIYIRVNVKSTLAELLDSLEAAEKDIALKEMVVDSIGSTLNAVANERDALRAEVESWKGLAAQFGKEADKAKTHLAFAKDNLNHLRARIEAMEKQEPVGLFARIDGDGPLMECKHALARCFALVGVGGEEAEKFSREHAKRVFGGNYSTIQWLDPWCRIPSSWHAADEDGLKAEFKEAAKDD